MHTYLEILVIIGSLAGMMWVMMRFMLKGIHKDLEGIKEEMKEIRRGLLAHEKIIDHLYQICIEMLGTRQKRD